MITTKLSRITRKTRVPFLAVYQHTNRKGRQKNVIIHITHFDPFGASRGYVVQGGGIYVTKNSWIGVLDYRKWRNLKILPQTEETTANAE